MTLSPIQTIIIIGMVMLGTIATRVLPFLIFQKTRSEDSTSNYSLVGYLGKVLPYAAIGLLVVYCLKNVTLIQYSFGLPEAIAIICIAVLHFWKGNALISIGVGTAVYMVLVQLVFT